jgi:hypothetical protein
MGKLYTILASGYFSHPTLDLIMIPITGALQKELERAPKLKAGPTPCVGDAVSMVAWDFVKGEPCMTHGVVKSVSGTEFVYAMATINGFCGAACRNQSGQIIGIHYLGGGTTMQNSMNTSVTITSNLIQTSNFRAAHLPC